MFPELEKPMRPIALALILAAAASAEEPVALDSGKISGGTLGRKGDVRVYRGIPFAAPPVGKLRWKPPQPVAPWEGVRKCDAFGPSCPQPKPIMGGDPGKMSEDCLTLNVWTMAKPGDKAPVMVWIHGGGSTTGSGSQPTYEGENFARLGVVLVTINYRLGPFGYFAHAGLSKESDKGVSGNYGFLDQIAALQWVKKNIAAFGGDPGCVTIFGESAGSAAVSRLMISPLAAGLFQRAIAESGGPTGQNRGLREMEEMCGSIAASLGCEGDDAIDALRGESADELLKAAGASQGLFGEGNKFGPIVDGWAIPEDPDAMWQAGKQADVPFLTGSNADEGTIFIQQLPIRRLEGLRLTARKMFGDKADDVLDLYPADSDDDVRDVLNHLVADSAFTMPARRMVRAMAASKKSRAFLYFFSRVTPGAEKFRLGAFHAAEIPYVFGNLEGPMGYDENDWAISKAMSEAWARFAKTGDQNGQALPEWPAYTKENDAHFEFGDEMRKGTALHQKACDVLEETLPDRKK